MFSNGELYHKCKKVIHKSQIKKKLSANFIWYYSVRSKIPFNDHESK